MDASVAVRVAASQASVNIAAGQPWAKAKAGFVKRIKGMGFIAHGSDISSGASDAFDGTYVFNVKVDNEDIIYDSPPTGFPTREGTEAGTGAISGIYSGSIVPCNTALMPGQELNVYVTTPANGESLFVLIAEDIPMMT